MLHPSENSASRRLGPWPHHLFRHTALPIRLQRLGGILTQSPMDLKRKRGDAVEDEMLDPDMSHFCMHARHSWLCNNVSNLKMPWDFRMNDQFDLVEKARKGLWKTVGVMPPVPRLEQSQPEPLESQLAMGSDRNFSVKALHNAQRRSWSEQINYDRKCAYRKWIAIVSENVMAFEVEGWTSASVRQVLL